ncbi:chemotaxis protein CheB [Massilia horti]|uniref:protein-glutamate methylesterase n=1 Tax=Massilia horti TaxID=2562153 RepID=A0A4Y9SXP0_9BURK|nr:chemotaxis protein CheB [Massilia horti]TFW31489.1 chemotaxis protein CheB [Massilia horti]
MSLEPDISRVLAGRRFELIVIGGSAGGFDALLTLLPALPAGFGLPAVCILHVPDGRDSLLAQLFNERLALPVREARDKEPIEPGTIYFAGAGYHLSIEQDRSFSLSCEPPVQYARPSIDVLLESAADAYGAQLAAVLLSGANHDGADGMAQVRACGGLTVVQDPREAQSPVMPAQAILRHTPDLVLPLARIAALLPLLEKP